MRRVGLVLMGVLLTVVGLGLVVLGGRELADGWARDDGPTVTATVTDLRVGVDRVRGVSMDSHEVRYLFDVAGATFSPGDASGRTNLFVAIDEQQWDELTVGGPIEVTYDATDPANNRPVAATGSAGDAAAGVVFGLLLAAIGGLVLLAARRRPSASPPLATDGPAPGRAELQDAPPAPA